MRHEDIQRIYKNHYFTSRRDMGGVKKLVGDVVVIVYFLNDIESTWTAGAKEKFKETNRAALQYILQSARSRGIDLKIRISYKEATVPADCEPENYYNWSKTVIAGIPAFQQKYEAANNCTEAPILFVLNKKFRSGAVSVDWESRMAGEMSIISSKATKHTIVHELLHQFGAMDLYYPAEVSKLIKAMGYDSVMGTTVSMHMDSLTTYLIGWSEEIDDATVCFLEKTKHLTKGYMYSAARKEYGKG